MTEAEINEKAREIYKRCFDDVYEYVGVINALVIAVRETAQEMADKYEKQKEINKELVGEIEELKDTIKNNKWAENKGGLKSIKNANLRLYDENERLKAQLKKEIVEVDIIESGRKIGTMKVEKTEALKK